MMNERQRVVAEALLALRLRRLIRVEEDLYCDLGYITHAEYQLFLDEKRAVGEYFQPDHWLGYTFPKGQGRLPVVGVRPADAAAFCAWLTQHDQTAIVGGWRYSLPHLGELATYDLHATEALGTVGGYWVRKDESFAFSPLDKRMPMLTMTRLQQRIEEDRALDLALDRALDLALARDFDRALDCDRALDLDRARNLARASALDLALDRNRNRALDRDLARARALALDLDLDLALDRNRALARVSDLDHSLNRALDRDRDRDRDLALARTRARDLDRGLDLRKKEQWQFLRLYLRFIFILGASRLLTAKDKQVQASGERWLDVYVDWVILEERIAGALPAFEGIRIVKERVKEE